MNSIGEYDSLSALSPLPSKTDRVISKISQASQNSFQALKTLDPSAAAEVRITHEWGDKESNTTVSAKASAQDQKGNSADLKVQWDSKNKGSVSAGVKTEKQGSSGGQKTKK